MKKVCLVFLVIFLSFFSSTDILYALNKEFKFEQETYNFRGSFDEREIKMALPEEYKMSDVTFSFENEKIAEIYSYEEYDIYFIRALDLGKTTIKAEIKGTNYVAYATINVEEAIKIDITKTNFGATLTIDSYYAFFLPAISAEAIEIKVTPLNSNQEGSWIKLGSITGIYTYDIKENSIVTVRWISTSLSDNTTAELYSKTITVNNIEPNNHQTENYIYYIALSLGIISILIVLYVINKKQKVTVL